MNTEEKRFTIKDLRLAFCAGTSYDHWLNHPKTQLAGVCSPKEEDFPEWIDDYLKISIQ